MQPTLQIYVALWHGGQWNPCGSITYNKASDIGGFSYLARYVQSEPKPPEEGKGGHALDPLNLNYRRTGHKVFNVERRVNPAMLHRVFIDYMPGKWGMKVLMAEHPEIKTMKAVELVHWFGSRAVGALSFYVQAHANEKTLRGIDELDRIRRKSIEFMMNRIPQINEPHAERSLTSHGGSRPKVSFRDDNGRDWLVKFNSEIDGYSCARVEAASANMARAAGIEVPDTKAVTMPSGDDVLFVDRFDKNNGNATHRISAYALLSDRVATQDAGDYIDVFAILKRISCDYKQQAAELLRRTVYNVAVNNTDDHLRQFEFVLCGCGKKDCYRLSPMYDAVPNQYPYPHVTSFMGLAKPHLDDHTLTAFAQKVGMDPDEALRVKNQVVSVVKDWRAHFKAHGVSPKDAEFLNPGFEQGLRLAAAASNVVVLGADLRQEQRQRASSSFRPTPSSPMGYRS